MITSQQLAELSKKYKTNKTVVFREYLQLLFLQNLYQAKGSETILFKGGTAIHFIFNSFRFSEDLDFICDIPEKKFEKLFSNAILAMKTVCPEISLRKKKALIGKSYLIRYEGDLLEFPVFVSLDFSFREKPLTREKTILTTEFPVVFSSFVYHLSGEEILAEKIRAIIIRAKGRDFFDLWYLLSRGARINWSWVRKKMSYYSEVHWDKKRVLGKLSAYSFESFQKDIKPFVGFDKREKLSELFELVKRKINSEIKSS